MLASRAVAPNYRRRWPRRVAVRTITTAYHAYAAIPVRAAVAGIIRIIEWVLAFVPFVISLWVGAFLRGFVVGWKVSATTTEEKRAVMREMLGGRDETP